MYVYTYMCISWALPCRTIFFSLSNYDKSTIGGNYSLRKVDRFRR